MREGLRQGCVMFPWLFNLYIDGVVREVNARALGRGLKLVDGNDNEWELNQLLFADDTVVVADSERKLCQLVTEFGRVCERRKLRVNVGKSKVMRCTRNEDGARLNVMLNGEALEEVDQFKYLGSVIAANGGVEADVHHRVNEGCKVLGAMKGVMKYRGLGMNVKKVLYEKVVVPTVMYSSESWGMKVTERQKLSVFEMKCLRSMTGVSWLDRVRNKVVRARTGVRRELAARVDMNVLRWFGHVERMDIERLLKKVMNAKVDGRSARGRPRFGWMDGVKRALNDRRGVFFCLFCRRVPDLLPLWWRRLGGNPSLIISVLLLRRQACRGLLVSAPCVRELPLGLCLLFGRQCHSPAGFPFT